MEANRKYEVFISYSRTDERLVAPLYQLLQFDGASVFRDVDSIRPGQRWRKEISTALKESKKFILFWCCHSAMSKWVEQEIQQALEDKEKQFLPILLCRTPLPSPIAEYQWTDFGGTVKHPCTHEIGPEPKRNIASGGSEEPPPMSSSHGPREFPRTLMINPPKVAPQEWRELTRKLQRASHEKSLPSRLETPKSAGIAAPIFKLLKSGFSSERFDSIASRMINRLR